MSEDGLRIKKKEESFCEWERKREKEGTLRRKRRTQRFALHLVTHRVTSCLWIPRYNPIWMQCCSILFFPGGDTRASLMRLVRALHSMRRAPSGRIVSFMTLITPYMRKPRYIMYLIIASRNFIIQNSGGYKRTFRLFIQLIRNL